jgi:outer membrane lipoprotein-sorting protein
VIGPSNRRDAPYLSAMKQIALALAFALSAFLPASAGWAGEKLSLSTISSYLNGLTTAQGPFTQVNDDGSLTTGKLYLHRPGRMRFEYDPPESSVVIAGSGAVMIHDPKSNQPPETYPLRRTPLSIILEKKVDLERANMVVGHGFDGTVTIITAQDPEYPEYGSIDLMFTSDPVELRKWVINDGSGGKTTVILGALQTGMKLSSFLFSMQAGAGAVNR